MDCNRQRTVEGRPQIQNLLNRPLENAGQSAPFSSSAVRFHDAAGWLAYSTDIPVVMGQVPAPYHRYSGADSLHRRIEFAPGRYFKAEPFPRRIFRLIAWIVADRSHRYISLLSGLADDRRYRTDAWAIALHQEKYVGVGDRSASQVSGASGFIQLHSKQHRRLDAGPPGSCSRLGRTSSRLVLGSSLCRAVDCGAWYCAMDQPPVAARRKEAIIRGA